MRLTTSNARLAVTARLSWAWMTTLVGAALLIVFAVDRATNAAPVQHLYYLPIIVAAFRFKMRGGLIAAAASILLYHLANPHLLSLRYEEQDLVQILLFLTVGLVTAKLTHDGDRLRQLALTDDLTGLHNLRSFETHLASMVRASRRERAPLAVFVVDVDRLKLLNDEHGHLTGAEAVRTVGHIIGQRLPPGAVACRYGGDEFAIAVPQCTSRQGRRIAEDWRQFVHASAPVLAGRAFAAGTLSISVGGTCAVVNGTGPTRALVSRDREIGEALFRAADVALYRAKATGRNRARITSAAPPQTDNHAAPPR
jgi:diguanylate cyclase (GGDEF)-like protein